MKNNIEKFMDAQDNLLPTYLAEILNNNWFFALDILGTIAFAISGLIIAYKQNRTIFGALLLAALPAIGGGVIRDLLVDRRPIAILSTPVYLVTIALTMMVGLLIMRLPHSIIRDGPLIKKLNIVFKACDTVGLAAFTIIGASVAVITKAEPLWLWAPLLAVITGAGGGFLRDLFLLKTNGVSELYAEVAALWGLIFAGFIYWQQYRANFDELVMGVVIIFFGVFITRLIAQIKNWHSPLFNPAVFKNLEK